MSSLRETETTHMKRCAKSTGRCFGYRIDILERAPVRTEQKILRNERLEHPVTAESAHLRHDRHEDNFIHPVSHVVAVKRVEGGYDRDDRVFDTGIYETTSVAVPIFRPYDSHSASNPCWEKPKSLQFCVTSLMVL